jgi:hypothetical protein
MRVATRAVVLAAAYFLVVGVAVSYEIGIRIHDAAHSEFAGWLSATLTFPSIFLVNFISGHAIGVRMGDSNTSFALIAGIAAVLNAAIFCALANRGAAKPGR